MNDQDSAPTSPGTPPVDFASPAGQRRIDIAFGHGHLPVCLPARAEPTVIRKARLP